MSLPANDISQTSAWRLANLWMIPADERSRRALMIFDSVFNSYFDESGTHDGSLIVSMAGLISSYDSWARLEIEWQRILNHRGIDVFHYTDFMARKEPYQYDWSNKERDTLMERLCTTISDNITVGIGISVFRDEYEQVLTPSLKAEFKDPYFFCLFSCLHFFLTWEGNFNKITLPYPLQFLFDRKPAYEGYAAGIFYDVIRQLRRAQVSGANKYGDMAFGSKDTHVPLQAADLLVGVATRNFLRERRRESFKMEKSLKMMGKSGSLMLVATREDLLQRYVEIVSNDPRLDGRYKRLL
jgi:hypothetical protein